MDADGRVARECPDVACSPGYFKVKPGTGVPDGQEHAYCPYCRQEAGPDGFATKEQARYAEELLMREVHQGVDDMVRDALGLGHSGKRKFGGSFISMEMSMQSAPLPYVRPPFEDEVRRDVVCPHCTLDQTVFGLAAWCADCGADIFLTHVAAELSVTRSMVGDIDRRRETLGRRVAAKDLENCLEDAVSLFEAALKALARRWLNGREEAADAVESRLRKIGNKFQSIPLTQEVLAEVFSLGPLPEVPWSDLNAAFEKRHPITHNLGVIDRKYLERAQVGGLPGREVRITAAEVNSLLSNVLTTVGAVHMALFPADSAET
ncbi:MULTISPECIES: hypothetical protein [unclassified Rubrivivax]|uniref:hypothetical protein n=1 Tax=unclassified Rubrivivax TaxID=2649762 RepID=UPI001E4533A3|nr:MULTISPECIES: hypothetical protein [unclassified Rubrivivax]MCC9598004.1 hypothetical protein [Rubrivivax sp. JA1055]MCC9645739.1 hypothetical protein [Rubrivivax sp. JA1029]